MDNGFNFESFDSIFGGFNSKKQQICPICPKTKLKIKEIREKMKKNIDIARKTSENEFEYLQKIRDYYVDIFKELGKLC